MLEVEKVNPERVLTLDLAAAEVISVPATGQIKISASLFPELIPPFLKAITFTLCLTPERAVEPEKAP